MKRALVIGSTAAGLQEAATDATAWEAFLANPGYYTLYWNGSEWEGPVWRAIYDAENKVIAPYEVRHVIADSMPIEMIEEHIGWLQQANDRVFITSNHGFFVKIEGKPYYGYYFGEDCVYTFGYMQEKIFRHLEGSGRLLRFHDMCFAGGAKKIHNSNIVAEDYIKHYLSPDDPPKIKGFEIQPGEIQNKYVKKDTGKDKDTLMIVASRKKQPALGAIFGGPGTFSDYTTQGLSLCTHVLLSSIRGLMPGRCTLQHQGINAIINLTNFRSKGVQHIWKSHSYLPVTSKEGRNQYIFTNQDY